MNLYLIEQLINDDYDTYDSAIVAAETEYAAVRIHPSPIVIYSDEGWIHDVSHQICGDHGWVSVEDIDKIKVTKVGETHLPEGVIISSFNSG